MKKEIGKKYIIGSTIILCKGPGISENSFSGKVVKTNNKDYKIGYESDTFIWLECLVKEYKEI